MSKRLRLKKMVNWSVQGPIILRLLTHVLAYNVATLCLLLLVYSLRLSLAAIAETPVPVTHPTFWQQAAPVTVCMIVMMPFMVWDLMKLSNRIAGPLFRFESLMKEFQQSGTLGLATLRKGDLLEDFESNFNRFAEKLHALHPSTRPAASAASGDDTATVPFRQSVS